MSKTEFNPEKIVDELFQSNKPQTIEEGSYRYVIANGYVNSVTYIGNSEIVKEEPKNVIQGFPIENFKNMFLNNENIKSVDMSSWDLSNIKSMNSTFKNCKNLESVNFGEGIPKLFIAQEIFENCENLKEVKGLKTNETVIIFTNGFSGCKSIESIDLSKFKISGNMDKAFNECHNLKEVIFHKRTGAIETNLLFNNCKEIEYINLEDVILICDSGERLIMNCPKLKRITLSAGESEITIRTLKSKHPNVEVLLENVK